MPAITHMRTVLSDADEAYDFIERTFAQGQGRRVGRVGSPALEFRSASTPSLMVDRVTNRMPTSHLVQLLGDCAFVLCLTLSRWGMPPMRHLREIRLDQARCELDSPELEGTPVAEVARRWGFAHTGRFRAAVHRRYGQDPAHRMRPRERRVP